MKDKLQSISDLLSESINNAGDNRGRDGEYMSDSLAVIREKVDEFIKELDAR